MSDKTKYDRSRGTTSVSEKIECPECSTKIILDQAHCPQCGEAIFDEGILSYIPSDSQSTCPVADADIDTLFEKNRVESHEDEADKEQPDLLSEIFDVRRDLWRVLVAEHISGRCLDMYAGFGRRSMLISELANTVYAADPDRSRLKIAAKRDDYESSNKVVPIHAMVDCLPFETGGLDTIVADLTNRANVRSELASLERYLDDNGSLIFLADGWTHTTGLTGIVGIDDSTNKNTRSSSHRTAAGYRSIARSIGFDNVSIYALFPTASRPLYAFDIQSDLAVNKLIEHLFEPKNGLVNAWKPLLLLANRSNALKYCYPSYLVTCTNDHVPPAFELLNPLVIPGRARSVVLDVSDQGVSKVLKVPNRDAHAPFTEREHSLLTRLQSSESGISSALPEGEATGSRFGQVRTEQPIDGVPLDKRLDGSGQSLRQVLHIGLDWLIDFQQAFRDRKVVRSPSEVREDLRFEPSNLAPPEVTAPVVTLSTAAHGDYLTTNIYTNEDEVASVIDWEYGGMSVSSIIDAGLLLIDAVLRTVGDFEQAIRIILGKNEKYSSIINGYIQKYCDSMDIPHRTFVLYLPSAYLHRLAIDWQYDAVSTYTRRMDNRIQRINAVYRVVEEMGFS